MLGDMKGRGVFLRRSSAEIRCPLVGTGVAPYGNRGTAFPQMPGTSRSHRSFTTTSIGEMRQNAEIPGETLVYHTKMRIGWLPNEGKNGFGADL